MKTWKRQIFPASMTSNHLRALYGGKGLQEIVNGFSAFQVIDEVLQRNTSTYKDRSTTHGLWVGMNNSSEILLIHERNISNESHGTKS